MVYDPMEDSFLLEKAVKQWARGKVLDMGTGSAIQALAAKSKGLQVLAADIDPEAVALARAKGLQAIESDLFNQVIGRFDTIVFNPPYLPDESPHDIALDGGPTGRELLDRFLDECPMYLEPKGQVLFVQSTITGTGATGKKLASLNMGYEVVESQKISWEQLVVYRAWCEKK